MEITARKVGKCKVLDCSGPITLGQATAALRKAVLEAVQDGTLKVVLNLENVPFTDDAGTAEFVSGLAFVKNKGGGLFLLKPVPEVQKWLVVTNLAPLFDIFDDEQKAIEGCE